MSGRAYEIGVDRLEVSMARGGDLDDVMKRAVEGAREALGCSFAALGLLDADGAVVLRAVSSSTPVSLTLGHRQALGEGITGEAIRRRAPVLVPNVRRHPNYVPTGPDIVSEICCPLDVGDGPFGFLDVATAAGEFGPLDLERVTRLARQVAGPVHIALVARENEARRDELAAMIVHDLRNPAAVLSVVLDLLEKLARAPEESSRALMDEALREAREACDELFSLIDGILTSQKADSGRLVLSLALLEPHEALPMIVSRMRLSAAARRVVLECKVSPDAPPVRVDASLLTRVLENLVSNALKFTPPGGSVVVNAERAPSSLLAARLPAVGCGLLVSVCDTGTGIPEAEHERIFEKYGVVDGRRAGRYSTGLGLAFARKAITAHGGVIWVERAAPAGSAFRFLLPAARVAEQQQTHP